MAANISGAPRDICPPLNKYVAMHVVQEREISCFVCGLLLEVWGIFRLIFNFKWGWRKNCRFRPDPRLGITQTSVPQRGLLFALIDFLIAMIQTLFLFTPSDCSASLPISLVDSLIQRDLCRTLRKPLPANLTTQPIFPRSANEAVSTLHATTFLSKTWTAKTPHCRIAKWNQLPRIIASDHWWWLWTGQYCKSPNQLKATAQLRPWTYDDLSL